MTSRERINASFKHRTPDRTPVFEYVLISEKILDFVLGRPAASLHWKDCVREKGWENSVRQLAVDALDVAEYFGHDMLYQLQNGNSAISDTESHPEGDAAGPDDPVERVSARNRRKKNSPPQVSKENFLVYDFLQEEMGKRGIDLPILVPAYAHGIWTDIDLMQTMLLEPQVAHEHFSLTTVHCRNLISEYLRHQVDIIGIGGDFAGNAPLISPESYKTFIVPELKIIADEVHGAGKYAINASDGNLWGVLEDFLINCGVDGYLEIDLHAGMELKKLKNAYGDRITFLGNFDCGNTLSFSSPETIRKAVIQCLEDGSGNGGHIFTASNAITDSVSIANYFAMSNAYREYFNLPKLSY